MNFVVFVKLKFTETVSKQWLFKIKSKNMSVHIEVKRVTVHVLQAMKLQGEKITMLTGYDYSMARILDEAGVDVILVGDSASNVMAGHETTLPITLDQMIYHASSVVRAVKRALIVVDLPLDIIKGVPGSLSKALSVS